MIPEESESEVLPANCGLSTAIRTDDKFRLDLEKNGYRLCIGFPCISSRKAYRFVTANRAQERLR